MLQLILAAVLLLTSLSLTGMLSLWVARSTIHWFVRVLVFVAALSTMLLIPAYEPLVAFSVQGAVIATGIQVSAWLRKRNEPAQTTGRRIFFSLSSCLLLTACIAIAVAIAMELPTLGFGAWLNVVAIGVASGFATLIGVWIVARPHRRLAIRIATAIICCLGLSFVVGRSDSFLASLADPFASWPSDEEGITFLGSVFESRELIAAWASILAGLVIVQAAAAWLAIGPARLMSWSKRPTRLDASSVRQSFARSAVAVLVGLLMVLPTYVYIKLLTPIPIPSKVEVNSNGWGDIAAAGRMAESSIANSTISSYDTATHKQLTKAVKALAPVYERLDDGLSKKIRCPVKYSQDDVDADAAMWQRTLTRALAARGRLAELEGRYRDAADFYLQAIQLGYAIRKEGLMIHSLVGTACAGVGRAQLFECRANLPMSDLLTISSRIEQIENEAGPASGFVYRDRIWEQHAFGWHNHLCQILEDIAVPQSEQIQSGFLDVCNREVAEMRLLRLELTILAWRASSGRLPSSLEEMVPEFIDEVPVDPMSPNGSALQLRIVDDDYLLYSVGSNGIDEGGGSLDEEYSPYDGDLRLNSLYSPSSW